MLPRHTLIPSSPTSTSTWHHTQESASPAKQNLTNSFQLQRHVFMRTHIRTGLALLKEPVYVKFWPKKLVQPVNISLQSESESLFHSPAAAPIKETKQQSAEMAGKTHVRQRSNSVTTLVCITTMILQCFSVTWGSQYYAVLQSYRDSGGLEVIHFQGGWLNAQSERGATEQAETSYLWLIWGRRLKKKNTCSFMCVFCCSHPTGRHAHVHTRTHSPCSYE